MKKGRVLGIETSCDETSVAILDVDFTKKTPGVRIVKHVVSSQIDIHAQYGGVVPEVAARTHVPETVALLTGMLSKKDPLNSFDAIAVTKGPGLATALRVGIQAAQTLAWTSEKPLIGVNHLEGHLASAWLVPENRRQWQFPALALLVSGGHTELVLMKDFGKYEIIGSTRDDAAGEAFDKSAKLLGLGYPGGPKISKHAEKGNGAAIDFPRPMIHDPSLDMSFSGLKTAVRLEVAKVNKMTPKKRHDLCASIQRAIIDLLVYKTIKAATLHPVKSILLVGGVSANKQLRLDLDSAIKQELKGVKMLKPAVGLATDNAAMIAAAGCWSLVKGKTSDWRKIDAEPELDLS
ncbi:tRNA (adenosine(37)-N6)-threonylcarbamoyltransferase complex transferase subunit TsaD [Candidatus Uhrbacteria bacterium]|nr:tRNA (adenosine(37)-N6)-threonylcarbamoyltransferase complex transferase subunit TsaD [Candidatus Uhrbacteria bacterium]MBD3284546.1 tRNA (adenosine(37)-N6)-threonylcarbamoyltransferase complex transferase subunit TsaD [Candidatus Uhrbacteria bacterium]